MPSTIEASPPLSSTSRSRGTPAAAARVSVKAISCTPRASAVAAACRLWAGRPATATAATSSRWRSTVAASLALGLPRWRLGLGHAHHAGTPDLRTVDKRLLGRTPANVPSDARVVESGTASGPIPVGSATDEPANGAMSTGSHVVLARPMAWLVVVQAPRYGPSLVAFGPARALG